MADLEKIEKFMQLVRQYGFGKFEIKTDEMSFKFEDVPEPVSLQPAPHAPVRPTFSSVGGGASMVPTTPATSAKQESNSAPVKESSANYKEIRSPFVGTFYASPNPGSAPFAAIGQPVRKGDTLCIVEAMKLMNEIESEYNGVLREVLIDNESPIEYDQVLFRVEIL